MLTFQTKIPWMFVILFAVMLVLGCGKGTHEQTIVFKDGKEIIFETMGIWEENSNRIYSVYVTDLAWGEMEDYAMQQSYKHGRTTSVLFFDDRAGTPNVARYDGSYAGVIERVSSSEDTTYWVGRFDRWPSGEAVFTRYPGK